MENIPKNIQKAIVSLEETMVQNAEREWKLSWGRFSPNENQFGRTVIIPYLFSPLTRWEEQRDPDTGEIWLEQICTYKQQFTQGRHVILQGKEDGRLPNNIRIGFIGVTLLYWGKKPPITSIDFIIGNTKYPKIHDIPPKQRYQPSQHIFFKNGYEIKEKTRFIVYGDFNVKTKRYLSLIPLGFCLYKGGK